MCNCDCKRRKYKRKELALIAEADLNEFSQHSNITLAAAGVMARRLNTYIADNEVGMLQRSAFRGARIASKDI